ncbi:MAG: ABC transporter ATP-binding protein [Candidatus Thermoplasmatota archaeon]|nr:ABC transporter ATP-binding protein [Candidatus Thermoplasmatota archaeon]
MIQVRDLDFKYAGNEESTIDDLNLKVKEGKKLAIMGKNGSGKTTLLRLLAGFLEPDGGEIFFSPRKEDPDIAFSPEEPELGFFEETVQKEVEFYPKNLGLDHEKLARKVLKKIGIPHLKEKDPYLLSAGQARLVSIASVLSGDPDILLLDEPIHSLHRIGEEKIGEVLEKIDKTVIFTTHSSDFAYKFPDEVALMAKGKIIEEGRPERVFLKDDLLDRAGIRRPALVEWAKENSLEKLPSSMEEIIELESDEAGEKLER